MPELPEVQTVLDTLHAQMGHARIRDVQVRWARIIHGDPQTFASLVCGRRIEDYARIGKYLRFDLGDVWWIAHLRMEGKFYLQQPSAPVDARHVHVIFQLEDGRELRYHDTRKFGRMYAYPKQGSLRECPCFARVGKDALDETLSADELYAHLHARRITLKQALLDQRIIAGIGNIYADEICFAAGLHPLTKAYRLRRKDAEELLDQARRILNGAIRAGGTTIRSYTSSLGVDGRFQLQLKVHAKKGEPCPVCGSEIIKVQAGGRGTYYCAKCQKRR